MNNRKKRYAIGKIDIKKICALISNYLCANYEPTLLLNKYKKPSLKLGSQNEKAHN